MACDIKKIKAYNNFEYFSTRNKEHGTINNPYERR